MASAYLAIDLGATSGRAIVGVLDGDPPTLELHEVRRFAHRPCPTPTGPIWDLTGLWLNVLDGIRSAAGWCSQHGHDLRSVGVDTWGVDWALLGQSGELLSVPHCYRDPQNDDAMRRVLDQLGGVERLYARTGIQPMPLNTIFQLAARHAAEPRLLDAAERLVFLPDLLHYWLSGEIVNELTIASTSSLLDAGTGDWDRTLVRELGFPNRLFGPLTEGPCELGSLRPEVVEATGTSNAIRVVAPPSHDTACAVAATPADDEDDTWAYLASGSWSLMGAERRSPVLTDAALRAPFTNERGVDGTIHFHKNIAGLWLLEKLREEFDGVDYEQMTTVAAKAKPRDAVIDPNSETLTGSGPMSDRLKVAAAESGLPRPETLGELCRCIFDSLADSYGRTLRELESVLGRSVSKVHVIGGGSKNAFLNELTEDACRVPITYGPAEATAIGNLALQALALDEIDRIGDVRQLVRRSNEADAARTSTTPNAY